jgi:hypothetical protein
MATIAPTATIAIPTATATPTMPPPQPTATFTPPPAILISEFLADPSAVSDDNGEWIELYNAADVSVNLRGWLLTDLGSDRHTITADLWLEPGQYLVLARNRDPASNGGVLAVYTYSNLTLANGSDELLLLAPDTTEVDRVQWGDGVLTTRAGASLQRVISSGSQDWTTSSEPWPGSSGDRGSPGSAYQPPAAATPEPAASPTPAATPGAQWPLATAPSPLVIDEVYYDGSDREFVTLINVSPQPLDLSGWVIGDEETPGAGEGMYALPAGYQLSPAGIFVIARNGAAFRQQWGQPAHAEFDDTEGATPDLARVRPLATGQWALNDSGDEVILLTPAGAVADAVVFADGAYAAAGVQGEVHTPSDFSLQRVPGATYQAGADQRHRWLYAPPQPFTTIELPIAATAGPQWIEGEWQAVWGSLGAQSNFSSEGTAPPHYLLAAAAAQGLDFLAIADPTVVTPWPSTVTAVTLPAWRWTGNAATAIIYNANPQPTVDQATVLRLADSAVPLQWQAGDWPATQALPALAADTVSAPGALTKLYHAWRTAGYPLLPAGNAAPPLPGAVLATPRYSGLLVQQTDAAALNTALNVHRGWLTNSPGLWLTVAQRTADNTVTWMGATIAAQNEATFEINYGDRHGDLAGLALWQDDRPLRQLDLPVGNQRWQVTVPALPNTFLYAVATQSDGDFAVTAPIYVLPATGGAVLLNEVLPAPWSDHNGDGITNTDDEFIELYNPSPYPLSLDGWQLLDASAESGGGRAFTFGRGAVINGRSWLVLFQSESRLSLNNENEVVILRNPAGEEVDRIGWATTPGRGGSLSRLPNGATWQHGHPTAGRANEPFSEDRVAPYPTNTPTPRPHKQDDEKADDDDLPPPVRLDPTHGQAGGPPASVAQSKLAGLEADVEFYAIVTAPPGLFNATIYVADPAPDPVNGPYAGIGINVYSRQAFYPALQEGDRVRVRGVLKSFRGEMELQLRDAAAIQRVGAGTPLVPLPVNATQVGEALEGRLVIFSGIVSGWQGDSIFLDDPNDPTAPAVRVTVRSSTGWRRPYVNRGERWQVTGIVSQFASAAPWNDGYRVLVRYQNDLVKEQAAAR